MKNHFYFPYPGNKRNEVDIIFKDLDIEKYDTIIEPFCGSCAMSYYLSITYKKKFKYILNDIDENLITLLKMNEDEIIKLEDKLKELIPILDVIKYKEIIKEKTFFGWFLKHFFYNIRPGLFDKNGKNKVIKISKCPILNFLKSNDITFLNINAIDLIKDYDTRDNNNILFLLDPPYMEMNNNGHYVTDKNHNYTSNIYKYLFDHKIDKHYLFIVEYNWIVQLLRLPVKIVYDKLYQPTKIKTKHAVLTNII